MAQRPFFSSSLLPLLRSARRRFSSLSSNPQNDAELVSNILLHHHNPFHAMESSLQLHGITLSPDLLHHTLLRLKQNSKIALALFHYANSLPSPPLTSHAFHLLIDIVAKVRQYDVAWQLILQMDPPTSAAFLILIRRLIASGLTRQAVRAFDDIETFVQTRPTSQDFIFLLDTLCKYGHVKLAAEVFNRRKHEYAADAKMYTVLVCGWCKIGRFDTAERFLEEMIQRGVEPNVVTYNVFLDGICRRASLHPEERFQRTIRDAQKVFDEMSSRGIEPDVTSFSIVLHVYSRAHKPELCLDRLKEMREKGICPTVATYTSVVKCLCSCGRLEEADELLGEMMRSGVTPSAATYNCFFKEYKGRKDAESALKLYRKMKEEGLFAPTVHTYNILVGMFLQLNRVEIVREIWDDMKESGEGPDLDSYTMLIHGLCEKQKWRDACQFFVEMIEKGLLPQKVTFETLYRGLIQSDMLRTWRRLKKKLDEESVTFGAEFQNYHLKPYRR
ncbi:PREDICTED: pentatricopeptide repeat-containing protein At2g13420, mitochondrial-like [Fragaria vesca subsp. vesca]|uniref:pentatricopeptide repeat-containing protein At2g13420, mitochondrial-like n=1 Tax=Fragaria vesca subsp. vesca TaxID=101020 RepID=UPI0002C3758B|nr:PREDICTED: pentatricopeptide repeat-containing protein At2g13420, mitochondrial-like [Fragaria vesca subsp. vesca]